jgi:hypothetical protein
MIGPAKLKVNAGRVQIAGHPPKGIAKRVGGLGPAARTPDIVIDQLIELRQEFRDRAREARLDQFLQRFLQWRDLER